MRNFSAEYRPYFAPKPQLKFEKYMIFVDFEQNCANFGNFFFQNEIFVEIGPQNTKNDFKRLLWILKMIFMHFMIIFDNLKIWLFENFLVSNRYVEPEMSQHDFGCAHSIEKLRICVGMINISIKSLFFVFWQKEKN